MGNKNSCCVYHSPKNRTKKSENVYVYQQPGSPNEEEGVNTVQPPPTTTMSGGVPHISEREPEGEIIV